MKHFKKQMTENIAQEIAKLGANVENSFVTRRDLNLIQREHQRANRLLLDQLV